MAEAVWQWVRPRVAVVVRTAVRREAPWALGLDSSAKEGDDGSRCRPVWSGGEPVVGERPVRGHGSNTFTDKCRASVGWRP